MTIKQYGGVFGRNPTFNDVEIEGDLSVDGTLTIGGNVITGLDYEGGWNASTNTPDLTTTPPAAGKFWIVSVAGSTNLGGITNWSQGDWALYDGSAWQRVEGGTVDLTNGVTGILPIANGGTNASDASTARSNLGSGAVGDNLFTATTALAAQQAMDTEVGVDVQAYDATILKSADIGVTVEAYDSTILKSADIGVTVEAYDSTILKSADIGVTVQGYDSTILNAADIGVTVEAYDATILKSADIGSTVQGYDADTAKYDDTTANFTGTLQNGGSDVVVDTDIGSTVQGYDADTAKLDVAQTWTAQQTFNLDIVMANGKGIDFSATAGTGTSELFDDYEEGTWTPSFNTSNGDLTSGYATQTGHYTKIGNVVNCYGVLVLSSVSGGTGTLIIEGLPYSVSVLRAGSTGFAYNFATNYPKGYTKQTATSMVLYYEFSATTYGQMGPANLNANTQLYFFVSYLTS